MHLVATLNFLRAAWKEVGIPEKNIHLKNFEALHVVAGSKVPPPMVLVFPADGQGKVDRKGKPAIRTAAPVPELQDFEDAIKGIQKSVFTGEMMYDSILVAKDYTQLEMILNRFFKYLAFAEPADMSVNPPVKLKIPSDGQIDIDWFSHSLSGFEVVTLHMTCDASVYYQTPIVPMTLIVDYQIAGGNPEE
ncbi:hypothetical protein [Deinococcus misasensis]|uniref:hypothetical protein n=1 Tax=Deinococcus misasensis TaxID=392413 RepID=UPI000553B7BF|nr:hypothetical protein [Deinococcus misasensis]